MREASRLSSVSEVTLRVHIGDGKIFMAKIKGVGVSYEFMVERANVFCLYPQLPLYDFFKTFL